MSTEQAEANKSKHEGSIQPQIQARGRLTWCGKTENQINLGIEANHRISTNIQRRVYGHATNVEIRPLNEEKAVQAAADLIGELFVFSVAGAAVIFEVQRSARSEARKEEARKNEIEAIRQKEDQLAEEILTMKQKLSELERLANSRGLSGLFRSSSVPDQMKPT
ncbi:OPA3-like protein [Panicum miliaceum]|uniref:OPA3-like protein n=1 Tax=Panicum miliaceum TaxID=4540 RepID=A0A3L6QHS1_PANMI|nr:OPA3-like protein [Panicum miliaceum]